MSFESSLVGVTIQKAFCLEAIADKPGCTSRYKDLPGKPLEDFIMAGINAGPVFERFAADWQAGERSIYGRFGEALKASNVHKSSKFINFGLLEIGFPTVAARLSCDDPDYVVEAIVGVMKNGTIKDVKHMIVARQLGWKSSVKREQKLAELTPESRQANSPFTFYETISKLRVPDSSARQWSQHYLEGLPLLKIQFDYLRSHTEPILERIKHAFETARGISPTTKIGILADMSAAAIFLHLSFEN